MQAIDFFRNHIDVMIKLNNPLAVLASRLPWKQIEEAVTSKFKHQNRAGETLQARDLFGTTDVLVGAGRSNAHRPPQVIHTPYGHPMDRPIKMCRCLPA